MSPILYPPRQLLTTTNPDKSRDLPRHERSANHPYAPIAVRVAQTDHVPFVGVVMPRFSVAYASIDAASADTSDVENNATCSCRAQPTGW